MTALSSEKLLGSKLHLLFVLQQDSKKALTLLTNMRLRQTALQFLMFTDKPPLAKYEKSLSVMEKITFELKSTTEPEKTVIGALIDFCKELCRILVMKDGKEHLDGDNACILTYIYGRVIEILVQKYKAYKEGDVMLDSLSKVLEKLSPRESCYCTLLLCKKLLQAMLNSAQYVHQVKAKKMEADLVALLRECNGALKEACCQKLCEVIPVQTLSQCVFSVLETYKDRKRAANSHLSSSLVLYPENIQEELIVMYSKLRKLYGAELAIR